MDNQEEVEKAATQDPVNITVYGNPVLDVIVSVGPYSANATAMKAINRIGKIRPDGTIEFKPDSYIVCYLQREALVFGPLNPRGEIDAYLPGGKYPIPLSVGEQILTSRGIQKDFITELIGPEMRLGGGGANVLGGFFNIFAQLKVQFIATVEKTERDGHLDPFIKALTDDIGVYDPIKLYDYPGMSLVIEGLGTTQDRIIFSADFPSEDPVQELPRPRGKSIMVNSVYSPRVAIDALANTVYEDRLGVLALTKRLCSKKPIDEEALKAIIERHKDFFSSTSSVKSVYDFVRYVVLPKGKCVCVMNEDELEHFTEMDFFIKRNKSRVPSFAGLIRALKKFRDFQMGSKHRIYVTAGPWGSFVLNENDHLIYCGIYIDQSKFSKGKTAIGDTYATFVLALETIGNYIRPYVIPSEDVICAAAGGADSSLYDGFGFISVAKVNRYVGENSRLVADLGPINAIPLSQWDIGLDEMRESDYQRFGRSNQGARSSTLQEVLGRAFLKT